jgi:hypothetical protein
MNGQTAPFLVIKRTICSCKSSAAIRGQADKLGRLFAWVNRILPNTDSNRENVNRHIAFVFDKLDRSDFEAGWEQGLSMTKMKGAVNGAVSNMS